LRNRKQQAGIKVTNRHKKRTYSPVFTQQHVRALHSGVRKSLFHNTESTDRTDERHLIAMPERLSGNTKKPFLADAYNRLWRTKQLNRWQTDTCANVWKSAYFHPESTSHRKNVLFWGWNRYSCDTPHSFMHIYAAW